MDRATAQSWLKGFQTAADALQPDEWVDNFYTEDATVRIANRPELRGREAMRQAFKRQAGTLDVMEHITDHFDVVGDRIYLSCSIRYVAKGDDPARHAYTFPAFAVHYTRQEAGKWHCYRTEVYVDQGPFAAHMAEKQSQ